MISRRHTPICFIPLALLAASCSSAADAPTGPPAAADAARAPSAKGSATAPARNEWRQTMSKTPAPNEGCFRVAHPSTTWEAIPCTTAPETPLTPAQGMPGEDVGGGTDFFAASSSTLSWAEGSFPSVTGVTSETDSITGAANGYTLQLNSNFMWNAPICKGATVPANCAAWQQFVYLPGYAFMQYWLINWGTTCPSGWTAHGGDCFENSSGVSVPAEPVTNLANMTVTGSAGSTDNITVTTGNGVLYSVNQASVVNLNAGWANAEFNVFGGGNGSKANFNNDASVVVRVLTSGSPTCSSGGTTGESNNLNLVRNSCAVVSVNDALIIDKGISFRENLGPNGVVVGTTSDIPVHGDFDGDGLADPASWNSSTGRWYRYLSGTLTVAPWVGWGNPGDVPAPADFDGDGKTDITVWRPSNGYWYAILSNGGGLSYGWGDPTDVPVPGDYDGDGKADIAVYRPSQGVFYIVKSSGGRQSTTLPANATPLVMDYDGDGKMDPATWTAATGVWSIMESSTGKEVTVGWGDPTDIPVTADYDGDKKWDIAVYRPSNGRWYVVKSTGGTWSMGWGSPGDQPVAGVYSDSGHADVVVRRPSNSTWYNGTSTF